MKTIGQLRNNRTVFHGIVGTLNRTLFMITMPLTSLHQNQIS